MIEKKKLLLFGANRTLINDFFAQLSARFEMLSCSSREEDILGHLKYYDADALVFCLYDERKEDFAKLRSIKAHLKELGSSLVVAGDGTKCDEFERLMPATADYTVRRRRTTTCPIMGMQIDSYLDSMTVVRKNRPKVLTDYEVGDSSALKENVPAPSSTSTSLGSGAALDDLLAAAAEAVNIIFLIFLYIFL